MLTQEQKIRLEKAVNDSPNLNKELKGLLINQMDSFGPAEAGKLEEALTKEHGRMNQVEAEFRDREHRLKEDYIKTLDEFHKQGMQKAFRKWESLEEEQNAGEIAGILNEAEGKDLRKTEKTKGTKTMTRLLIPVILAAAAAVYYFVFYKP